MVLFRDKAQDLQNNCKISTSMKIVWSFCHRDNTNKHVIQRSHTFYGRRKYLLHAGVIVVKGTDMLQVFGISVFAEEK